LAAVILVAVVGYAFGGNVRKELRPLEE